MDKTERAARNLYVISSGVIVYLLAGADIQDMSLLGLRAPARYPKIFEGAAIATLLWFWLRYQISNSVKAGWWETRKQLLSDLYNSSLFSKYLISKIQPDPVFETIRISMRKLANAKLYVDKLDIVADKARLVRVKTYFVRIPNEPHFQRQVGADKLPSEHRESLCIPRKDFVWRFLIYIPRFLIRRETFYNRLLPHVIFAVATTLILSSQIGADPAGIFGHMEPKGK